MTTKDNKYKYLAKNTMLFTISSFGTKLLVFLMVPLYTSVLSTAEYGVADIITTSGTLLGILFTVEIASAVLRFAIDCDQNQHQYLSYGLRVLGEGSVIVAISLLVLFILKAFSWDSYCYVFIFVEFFVLSLNGILTNYLRAIDKIKEVAIAGVITTLITILLNILFLVIVNIGLLGYLLAVSLGTFISSLYCLWVIHLPANQLVLDCCGKEKRLEMRRYSFPLIFNGIAWWMNNSLDKYFVIWMCGSAENGLLSVAYKIPTILTVLHSVFSQAWNLSAIKEFDKDDKDGFFAKTYSTYNAALVIACSILILLNVPIARILFAKDFFAAWQYSSVLLLSTLFSSLSGIIGSIFTAVKDSKVFAISTLVAAALNCVLNALLIYLMGTIGAAIATVVSFVCIWLIRLLYTKKYINWKLNLRTDIVAYILLCFQVIFEHLNNHMYYAQIIILIVIFILYRSTIIMICKKTRAVISRRISAK